MATSAKVTQVVGQVFAVAPSGEKRLLVEGDRLMAGEQVFTGEQGSVSLELSDGREVDLGRDSSFRVADDEAAAATDQPQDLDIDAIQAAEEAYKPSTAGSALRGLAKPQSANLEASRGTASSSSSSSVNESESSNFKN